MSMQRIYDSPLFLIAGIVVLAIGGLKFYHAAVEPRVSKLTGGA